MMVNISLSADQISQINLYREVLNHVTNGNVSQLQSIPHDKMASIVSRVDPSAKETPMLAACLYKDEDVGLAMIKILIAGGFNPLFKDNYAQTVIFYLARDGKLAITKYLVDTYDFNLNENDYCCQTPIFYACRQNRLEIIEYFVSRGANVNHKDKNGQTCLFYAALKGHYETAKLLIKLDVEIFHVDFEKKTAMFYARKGNNQQIIDLINSYKIKDKKMKEIEKVKEKDSSMNEKKKVKKESQKVECVLVFTDHAGNVHELNEEEIEEFKKHNERLFQLMCNPEQLDLEPTPPERKFEKTANKILNSLWKMPNAFIFHNPVDWEAINAKDYLQVVKRPMDFSTIKTKLLNNAYQNHSHFAEDMILVFDNCILYNGSEHQYGKIAMNLKKEFGPLYNEFFI